MKVEVRAFATLRSFLPPETRHTAMLNVPDGSTIRDVTRSLGIPDEMALVALLNGRETEPGQRLKTDDVVTLFPPLAGGCADVLLDAPRPWGAGGTLGWPLEASRNPVGLPDFKSGVRL